MPTKNNEQNAKDQAEFAKRKREAGLVRVSVWVKAENREKLKEYARELQK